MGALAEAIAARVQPGGPTCTLGLIIALLGDDDRGDLEAALASPFIPATAIGAGLRTLGHDVKDSTVQRHRRGGCGCPR